ncbi:MAG TPA: adenylate/guanylate cyclase domain-containing protein [Actinomycetota bacterium]|nr:adenylate/guanylate cyclase domain-containing protein [Actinomycetota bacterium]
MGSERLTVFLADDNVIVREGVRALLNATTDFDVVGVAEDYEGVIDGAGRLAPHVLITDIRMPPNFRSEGIDAAKEIRKRHPGTGIVVLSQYDDPEYAITLLADGAEGYAYLLKDRVAEGDELAKAVRAVAIGSSHLDPKIVEALIRPVSSDGELSASEDDLLRLVAEGRPYKRIAATLGTTPSAVAADVEKLFLKIAQGASAGASGALARLQMLHAAIIEREEVGETLARLLPGGLTEKLRAEGRNIGQTEHMVVTVLMSDVRGYSAIAEVSEPAMLARQLNEHRGLLNDAILEHGGTVMQYTGDGVMAVFGAPLPQPDHAARALEAAMQVHVRQRDLDASWEREGLSAFPLGVGLSTGEVAAALLGNDARLEYSIVGDTVNLSARLQDLARPFGKVVLSEATYQALPDPPATAQKLEPTIVKGRATPVHAYMVDALAQGENRWPS